MKIDRSMGIIVFYLFPRSVKYLIIKHKKGHWAFPKGHPEKGETKIQAATRELIEETGIGKIQFIKKRILLKESYKFTGGKGVKILKKVNYFIAEAKSKKVKIDNKEITNYKWCTYKTGLERITFKESKSLLKKADNIIRQYLND